MSADDTTVQTPPATLPTPGASLRAAREAAQLTPKAVAAELRLPEEKLQALEQDQYERMASDTFVRGYIRRYARIVKLDGEELIAAYEGYLQQLRATTEQVTQAQDRPGGGGKLPNWAMPAAIVVGLIVVWALAVSLFTERPAEPVAAAPQPQVVNPAAADEIEVDVFPGAADAANDSGETLPAPAPAAGGAAVTSAAATRAAVPEPEQPAPAPLEDRIDFVFSDECWIEVTDASGAVLIADLQQAGQSLSLSGTAPFSVMLGNARAATLALNGAAVAVNPISGRKTLRLTVGE